MEASPPEQLRAGTGQSGMVRAQVDMTMSPGSVLVIGHQPPQ
jgi:hypothetical protein